MYLQRSPTMNRMPARMVLPFQSIPAHYRRGMGDVAPQQISQIAATGASATISTLVALGTIGGPVGIALAGLVAVATQLVSVFKGCGQTCIEATTIADQVEPVLRQNLNTYLASPTRLQSMQTAALNTFDTAWAALTQACGNPQLMKAGQNCITDREQGSCAYKTSPGGWQQNSAGVWSYVGGGPNGSGSTCWNWFVGYRDPIANDPAVVPDSAAQSVAGAASSVLSSVGLSPNSAIFGIPLSTLAIPALLGVAALLLLD